MQIQNWDYIWHSKTNLVKCNFFARQSFFALIFLAVLMNFSCRKTVIPSVSNEDRISQIVQNENNVTKFFNSPLPVDAIVSGIKNKIQREELQKPFIEKFVKYAGYPVWEKAIIMTAGSRPSSLNREGITPQVILVPMMPDKWSAGEFHFKSYDKRA